LIHDIYNRPQEMIDSHFSSSLKNNQPGKIGSSGSNSGGHIAATVYGYLVLWVIGRR
jgi:hypothetical protein